MPARAIAEAPLSVAYAGSRYPAHAISQAVLKLHPASAGRAAVIAERSNIFIIKSIHRGDACVYDVALIELKLNVAGYGLLSVVDKSRKSFAKR